MVWLAWILVAVVCAVLFSVIKTLDRVTYAVQLLEARIDRMTAGIEEIKASLDASHPRLGQGAAATHAALGSSRGVQSTTRPA